MPTDRSAAKRKQADEDERPAPRLRRGVGPMTRAFTQVDFLVFRARAWFAFFLLGLAYWIAPKMMRPHILTGFKVMYDESRLSEQFL